MDQSCKIQKIDWSLYQNPAQFFTSERELGKLDPQLSMLLPTLQDIFKIKESGTKFKTKLQKLSFIQACGEQLANLPYDTKQLQKIRDFLKLKATEYKINLEKVGSLDATANFLRHSHETCICAKCQEAS